MAPRLHIIVTSTRPGRVGPKIAQWFHGLTVEHGKFDARLVDLADFNLPVFDEPDHPMTGNYHHEHTKGWSESVAAADAIIFATPEYNYFAPPSLVNALDYLHAEWAYKPVGFVSYGGVSGGLRAVQPAKQLLTTLNAMPIPQVVAIPNFWQFFDEDGEFVPNEAVTQGVAPLLDALYLWTEPLKALRAA